MHSIIKLLTLNIKTMKKEDLKLGEYYVYDKRQVLIFKDIKVNTKVLNTESNHFSTQSYAYSLSDIRLATPEEKHWLDVCINKDTFILLNYFMKQTQKTPQREIEKAKRLLKEYKERNDLND